jgi:hypothetical protein
MPIAECRLSNAKQKRPQPVAQAGSLLYRRLAVGSALAILIRSFVNIVGQLLRQRITAREYNNSHDEQRRADDITPDIGFDGLNVITNLDLMMRDFEADFQHSKYHESHSDNVNQRADGAFHSARPANQWRTDNSAQKIIGFARP